MTKRCRHTILGTELTSSGVKRWLACANCGEQFSLGPSFDGPDAVQVEMRAAVLEDTEHWGPLHVSTRERWGIEDQQRDDSSEGDEYVSTDEYLAGWLSAEIESHDVSAIRDSNAWSWDVSRPIAEQLAETLRVDAEADEIQPIVTASVHMPYCDRNTDSAFPCNCDEPDAVENYGPSPLGEHIGDDTARPYKLGDKDPSEDAMRDPPANEAADFDPFTCPVIPGDFGGPHGAIPVPEHPPDPECVCGDRATDASMAISCGWTHNDQENGNG